MILNLLKYCDLLMLIIEPYQEMQQVKAENNNLVGRLGQSDEKTASFKSLLQTLGEQLRKVEKENRDLKIVNLFGRAYQR